MKEPAKQVHIQELNLYLRLCTWDDKWTHVLHKGNPLRVAKCIEARGGNSRIQSIYYGGESFSTVGFAISTSYWYPYQEITDTTPITIEELKEQVVF